MSAKPCSHVVEVPGPLAMATFAEAYDFFSNMITYQLRNGIVERVDTNHVDGAVAHTSRVSGAIFFTLHPKHLSVLIGDARASIALAIQRHLSNEQYRRRLAVEFHYRALRRHLSTSFRLHMVPPSTSGACHFFADRNPGLAVAYGKEIDRLEADLLMTGPVQGTFVAH